MGMERWIAVRMSNNTKSSTQLKERVDKNLHHAFTTGGEKWLS